MKIVPEVFETLRAESYYERYDHLLLPDKPNQGQIESIQRGLKRINKEGFVSENTFFAFARPEKDICLGATFDVLFPMNEPGSFVEVEAKLLFIHINKMKVSEKLFKGYSGICLFEFLGKKPEMLEKLKVYGKERVVNEHDMLFLSQKVILDRVLELLG